MDYMASLAKVNFGAQGYAAAFVLSVFDREWKPDLNLEQSLDIIKKCIHELNTRFLISQPKFVIKIVDAAGTRNLEL
jgi:20S proteasome alpha/beta subunit